MESLEKYIGQLTDRVEQLVRDHGVLKRENELLRQKNVKLEQLVIDQKNALEELEEQNKVVKIAHAVMDDEEDRREQKKRLNHLVREIDKCIALLNN